jgi:hypothetical protein
MRKIEERMVKAIKSGKDWQSGNTRVSIGGEGVMRVHLHGHHIANVWNCGQEVNVNLRGWNTPTTRSRLTALSHAFVPGCNGVCTKRGQTRVAYRVDGSPFELRFTEIPSDQWVAL